MRTKRATNKRMKKRTNYNAEIIERLQKKYGVSKRYIQMSLSEDRKSETSETIKKDYAKMKKAVKELLKTL